MTDSVLQLGVSDETSVDCRAAVLMQTEVNKQWNSVGFFFCGQRTK